METPCLCLGAVLNACGHPAWTIGAGYILGSILWYLYLLEMTRRRGQTVGKIVARIQVVAAASAPDPQSYPLPGSLMARRLSVEFLFDMAGPLFMAAGWALARVTGTNPATGGLVGLGVGSLASLLNPAAILRTPRKQALHDLAARTCVVRVPAITRVTATTPQAARRELIRRLVVPLVLSQALSPALVFGVVRPLFVEAYVVPSGSMEPTIQIGDRILANKLLHHLRMPRHGEIIMFRAPEWALHGDEHDLIFVKRVVGLPGDRLQVKDGRLYRNGQPVAEPYLSEPPDYTWPEDALSGGEITVPAGSLVVLGDNRNNSADSHLWEQTLGGETKPAPFLPADRLVGNLVWRFWPPDRLGTVLGAAGG